jgi:hypothetical protein
VLWLGDNKMKRVPDSLLKVPLPACTHTAQEMHQGRVTALQRTLRREACVNHVSEGAAALPARPRPSAVMMYRRSIELFNTPPPSLPYKVDTSRPSLRTNWTRLTMYAARGAQMSSLRRVYLNNNSIAHAPPELARLESLKVPLQDLTTGLSVAGVLKGPELRNHDPESSVGRGCTCV